MSIYSVPVVHGEISMEEYKEKKGKESRSQNPPSAPRDINLRAFTELLTQELNVKSL